MPFKSFLIYNYVNSNGSNTAVPDIASITSSQILNGICFWQQIQ